MHIFSSWEQLYELSIVSKFPNTSAFSPIPTFLFPILVYIDRLLDACHSVLDLAWLVHRLQNLTFAQDVIYVGSFGALHML